jgi:hypothetical protein
MSVWNRCSEGLMKNPSIERPSIASPVMDAPAVDITGVVLSSPPNYTKGKQVIAFIFFLKISVPDPDP